MNYKRGYHQTIATIMMTQTVCFYNMLAELFQLQHCIKTLYFVYWLCILHANCG